LHTPWDWV